jgi:hypothetical protein
MESLLETRPSVLALFSSLCVTAEGTQLVAEIVAFPLVMLFFTATCFTRIYKSMLGGYAREEQGARIGNGGGSRDKELVNSTNPQSPPIYLL